MDMGPAMHIAQHAMIARLLDQRVLTGSRADSRRPPRAIGLDHLSRIRRVWHPDLAGDQLRESASRSLVSVRYSRDQRRTMLIYRIAETTPLLKLGEIGIGSFAWAEMLALECDPSS